MTDAGGRVSFRGAKASSLTRQLALPAVGLVAVVVIIGVLAVVALLSADSATDDALDRVRPLTGTQAKVTAVLRRADLATRTAASPDELDRIARDLFRAEQRLASLGADDQALAVAVERQSTAIDAWREGVLDPALDGRRGASPERSAELLLAVQTRADAVEAGMATMEEDIRDRSGMLLRVIEVVIALAVLLGAVSGAMLVLRLRRDTVEPLEGLAAVLDRLRSGDGDARAQVTGPQEVREIAFAINMLADENLRGRDVESEVLDRLAELDRVRNDLVSTVSHELRTPLTSIRGYLELLQDQMFDDLDESQVSMMGVIRRNLDRLNELISNLLALSYAEGTVLTVDRVDLRSIANEVASDVRVVASSRDITVRTAVPADPVMALGDRAQLIRAVTNLVANAVKFSRPGGTVEVRVEQQGQDGLVTVTDEGIGIPVRDLRSLGSRFYRASNAIKAEIGGTGLGLRIVQTILDQHGGTLAIDSLEGEGTTATVRMPLRHDFPMLAEVDSEAAPAMASSPDDASGGTFAAR